LVLLKVCLRRYGGGEEEEEEEEEVHAEHLAHVHNDQDI
jgi:hypothetical protein